MLVVYEGGGVVVVDCGGSGHLLGWDVAIGVGAAMNCYGQEGLCSPLVILGLKSQEATH